MANAHLPMDRTGLSNYKTAPAGACIILLKEATCGVENKVPVDVWILSIFPDKRFSRNIEFFVQ
jgi:hypothetical protein